MDLVVNHTSDQHAWFQESRSSTTNQYRDWYIWRKPRFDECGRRQPPNNWSAYFGGSAWTFDELTGEYYLHLFAPEQPDLNWECEAMREEVYATMRFWLDKGVDGFRMDVINLISKDPRLPDATVADPSTKYHHGCEHYANGPRIHEYLRAIGAIMEEYSAFSVGEMPWISDANEILRCVGSDRKELNMIFNFDVVEGIDHGVGGKFSPRDWQMADLKEIVSKWQTFMYENHGWNAIFAENHDQARTISRWASDEAQYREQASKMFATFLGLQSGTIFLYQGQELGMSNIPEEWGMDEFRDLETLNHWQELQEADTDVEALQVAKKQYHLKSRDNARTPMQWSNEEHAGFTTGRPWFRVNDSYQDCNALSQVGVAGSPFEYWAEILRLRKQKPDIFAYGDFQLVDAQNDDIFAYIRSNEDDAVLVVCNFRAKMVEWSVPKSIFPLSARHVLASVFGDVQFGADNTVLLRPFEAFVCANGGTCSRL